MTVKFYDFAKVKNSTKTPDSGGVDSTTTYSNVVLKDANSVSSPTITVTAGAPDALLYFNYCWIEEFKRYYFITDWTTDRGLWTASLECDVLATWKEAIGNSKQYTVRSADIWNPDIADSMYPTLPTVKVENVDLPCPWLEAIEDFSVGYYVLGIINGDNMSEIPPYGDITRRGCVSYYGFEASAIAMLLDYLMSDTFCSAIGLSGAAKLQYNPLQYLSSCIYIPWASSSQSSRPNETWEDIFHARVEIPEGHSGLPFGWWDIPLSSMIPPHQQLPAVPDVYNLERLTQTRRFQTVLPPHPQASTRGTYLNYPPYSHYTMVFPPFGEIALTAECLSNFPYIDYAITVDVTSGLGRLDIYSGNKVIISRTGQVGIETTTAIITRNSIGTQQQLISGALGVAGSLMSGNYFGAAAGAITTGINSALTYAEPKFFSAGEQGSIAHFTRTPYITISRAELVEENFERLGRPLCEMRKQSSLVGYRQCSNVYFKMNAVDNERYQATENERQKIVALMEGGYYYD